MKEESAAPAAAHRAFTWTLRDPLSSVARAVLERFPDLEGLPGARVLKSNHFRTVFHLPGESTGGLPGLVAKVYRYTSSWDRLRYVFLRHRALQEWTALGRFADLGLPTARPVAVAERRERGALAGGGLIVEFLEGTVPLSEALHRFFSVSSPGGEGLRALEQAAGLVRRMHDAGVWHRDLHAGNILRDEGGGLYLIDLHTCVFQRTLWRWQRRSGVAKLLHSIRSSVPPEGLRRLIAAYGPEALGGSVDAVERDLLRRVGGIHRTRVKSRSKRCFLPSTQFQVERRSDGVVYHLRKVSGADLERLWNSVPPGPVIKSSANGWVARAEAGGASYCVKFRRYGLLESLQALFESHRLRRAYGGGHALSIRGIATPQVVALREGKQWGLVREAHLVTELLGTAVPLDEFLFSQYWGRPATPQTARRKRRIAEAVGHLVRRVHDCGLYPHDLSPQNVLLQPSCLANGPDAADPLLYLTDLDHLYLWKPLTTRARLKNLADIGNLPEGHITAADRLRGLRAYAQGEPGFTSAGFLGRLERRLLTEHFKVLDALSRRERSRRDTTLPSSDATLP